MQMRNRKPFLVPPAASLYLHTAHWPLPTVIMRPDGNASTHDSRW